MVVYRKVASTSMFYYLGNRNFAVLWKAVDYTAVHCVETVILQMRRTKVYLMVAN